MHFQNSVDGTYFSSQESFFSVPVSCLAGWRVREKGRWRCLAIGQDLWRSFFSFVPCRRHFEMLLIRGFPLRLGRRLPLLRGVTFPLSKQSKNGNGDLLHLYEMISKRVKYLLRQIQFGEKIVRRLRVPRILMLLTITSPISSCIGQLAFVLKSSYIFIFIYKLSSYEEYQWFMGTNGNYHPC